MQGYVIVSPLSPNYLPARDALIAQLEADGPAYLKLPTRNSEEVMCEQYRWEETQERGGIAIFDMVFIERGMPIVSDARSSVREDLFLKAGGYNEGLIDWLNTVRGQNTLASALNTPIERADRQETVEAFAKIFGGFQQ